MPARSVNRRVPVRSASKEKAKPKVDSTTLIILVGHIGAAMLAYPSFSNWWNSMHQSRAVASYVTAISKMDTSEYDAMTAEAEAYNREIAANGIKWIMTEEEKIRYNSVLNVSGSGIMGYIDIPKVHIQLPIYHGTDEAVLQIAVGHIEGSSLPVGGPGSHCVVSGHRGLPSAKLFTDIDKLVEGDTFTLSILNNTLTYQVDQIRVFLPTDLSDLRIEDGKDYVTLVTCTPYGVNTHRLLVRAHRIENAQGDVKVVADALLINSIYVIPFVAVPIIAILLILMFAVTGKQSRNRRAYASLKAELADMRMPETELEREREIRSLPGKAPIISKDREPASKGRGTGSRRDRIRRR